MERKNNEMIIIAVIVLVLIIFFGSFGLMRMWNYGWMFPAFGFMWIFMFIIPILVIIALILFILWLVKQLQNKGEKR